MLINKACRRIKLEIGEDKCGIVQNTGTWKCNFLLKGSIRNEERSIPSFHSLYKNHKKFPEMLANPDLHGKDIEIIYNLNWRQIVCM